MESKRQRHEEELQQRIQRVVMEARRLVPDRMLLNNSLQRHLGCIVPCRALLGPRTFEFTGHWQKLLDNSYVVDMRVNYQDARL